MRPDTNKSVSAKIGVSKILKFHALFIHRNLKKRLQKSLVFYIETIFKLWMEIKGNG